VKVSDVQVTRSHGFRADGGLGAESVPTRDPFQAPPSELEHGHSGGAGVAVERVSLVQVLIWLATVVTGLVLSIRIYDWFQLGTYRDDATYVILAESLARGPAYGLINEPGPPGSTNFPIGFPLLLVPFDRISGAA
jgi:hypothetical protein